MYCERRVPIALSVLTRDQGAGPIAGFQRRAIFKFLKLSLLICSSGAYRVLMGSLFRYRHSPGSAVMDKFAFASSPCTVGVASRTRATELKNAYHDCPRTSLLAGADKMIE
jgi:hypothetical protein